MWKRCKAYFTGGRFEHSIASELVGRIWEHNIAQVSGQLAYFLLLSAFPFLIYVNNLIGALNLNLFEIREFLEPIFPQDVVSMITTYVDYVSENRSMSLLSFGVLVSIFSASKSVRALSTVLDNAYGAEKQRGFWWNLAFSLMFIFGIGLAFAALVIIIPLSEGVFLKITEPLGISTDVFDRLRFWRWAVTVLVLFAVLTTMYYFVPNRRVHIKNVLPGAGFGVVGFVFLTRVFSVYVGYFLKNSALYGSINAVILLLLWLYCAGLILAVGAELNGILDARFSEKTPKSRSDA